MRHQVYQKPCSSGLLKTIAQQEVSGSTRLWSITAPLELKCCCSVTGEKKKHPNICPVQRAHSIPSIRGQGSKYLRKLFPHMENKHFGKVSLTASVTTLDWVSLDFPSMVVCKGCRQQEGINQFSAEPWTWAQLIIWVLTLFYVLRF